MANVIAEFLIGLGYKVDDRELDKAQKKALEKAKEIRQAFTTAFAAVGAAAVGAAGGIFKLAENAATTGDEIAKTSKALGVAASDLQRLRFAAGRSGADVEVLRDGIKTLQFQLEEAVTKGTGPAAEGLKTIGLNAGQLAGLGLEDKFGVIADRLNAIPDKATRTATAMKIFGESGFKLIPLLSEGSAGMKALGDEAQRLGLVMTGDALKSSEDFTDALSDTKQAISALVRDVGSDLIPAVKEVIDEIREWTAANRDAIREELKTFIKDLIGVFKSFAPVLISLTRLLVEVIGWFGQSENAAVRLTPAIIALTAAVVALAGPWGAVATGIALVVANLENLQNAGADVLTTLTGLDDLLRSREPTGRTKLRGTAALTEGAIDAGDVVRADAGLAAMSDEQLREFSVKARSSRARNAAKRRLELRRAEREGAEGLLQATGMISGSARAINEANKRNRKKGQKKVDTSRADELFGDELRRLAEREGVGDIGLQSALEAGAQSLQTGAVQSVARNAALSRLGALSGKDLTAPASDPLLSTLLGEDVPDVELSAIARGAEPQTLISTINNTFNFDIDQDIAGAGDPAAVGDAAIRSVRDMFVDSLERSTKTAKVRFKR